MGNGSIHPFSTWLKAVTDRPGWSVARLARAATINEATIWGYIRNGITKRVTVDTVTRLAIGAGVGPVVALAAAAGIPPRGTDPEIDEIIDSDLPDDRKRHLIALVWQRRERDREAQIIRDMDDTRQLIQVARKANDEDEKGAA